MTAPDHLYFTDDDEANALIATDPFALLVGFALDQQITVQQAFAGPLRIKQRVGTLDPARLARSNLEPIFKREAGRAPLPRLDGPARAGSRRVRRCRSTAATRRGSGPKRATAPT